MKSEAAGPTSGTPDKDEELAQVVAECSDRMNAGLKMDRTKLLAEHPHLARELTGVLSTLLDTHDFGKAPLPRSFGDYQLIREVGRGGMGIVYEAWQVSLDRRVALKVLYPSSLEDPRTQARFKREMKAPAKLDHPGICTVYDAGEIEGTPFIAMRYLEGEPLARKIRRARGLEASSLASPASTSDGIEELLKDEARLAAPPADSPTYPATQKEILAILRTVEYVARSLHVAHEAGLVHRDIKPGNIMILESGDPVVIDFGLAGTAEQPALTRPGDRMGTPTYMSPEQIAGRQADRRTDVYSLGVTLYEWLTHRLPFDAPTREGTYQKILRSDPPAPRKLNPHISKDLKIILQTVLEKDLNHRYKTAFDFAEDLRRIQASEPIRVRPAGPLLRFGRFSRRYPLVTGLLFGITLLLLMVSLLLFVVIREWQQKEAIFDAKKTQLEVSINKMWQNRSSVTLLSEDRAILTGTPLLTETRPGERIKFGVYTHVTPSNMIDMLSPILSHLEAILKRNIDLRIYEDYRMGIDALTRGDVDFMRLGGHPYIEAKDNNPRIFIIAAQDQEFQGCIFTRSDSDIQNLHDLIGKQFFLFGDRNSTTGSALAKAELVEAGIHSADLPNLRYFDDLPDRSSLGGSHDGVVQRVRGGQNIAGAAKWSEVKKYPKELRSIRSYPSIPMPWVAREGLDLESSQGLKKGLLALNQHPDLLMLLEDNVKGFKEASDRDYDTIRQKLRRSAEFDKPRPAQSSDTQVPGESAKDEKRPAETLKGH